MPISEYIIKQKNEGMALAKKIFAIVGYVCLTVVLLTVVFALASPLLYIPFILLTMAFIALIIFATWRFFCVEYEIVIGNGELCASVIYGRSVTKRLVSVSINDLSEIGIYDDEAYRRLCAMSLQKNDLCISSLSAPEIYYAIYDDGKDRCILYFETNERGISILKQQNPSAFRASQFK